LDDSTVVLDKGHCPYCDTYWEGTDGTLAFTGNYGLDLPNLSQSRVEADLAVFRNYERLSIGKLEDCKQKLNWGVEHYAKLPQPPQPLQLLELEDTSDPWKFFGITLLLTPVAFIAGFIVAGILFFVFAFSDLLLNWPFPGDKGLGPFVAYIVWGCTPLPVLAGLTNLLRVMVANGGKPSENSRRRREFARRQKEHEKAVARALKAAEPIKAAEDYRLLTNIRGLESEIRAVREKAEAVRRLQIKRQ
jgi:hypothetical protein